MAVEPATPPDPTRRAPAEEDERGDAVVFGAPKDVRPMKLTFTGSRRGTPLVAPEDGDDPTRRAPADETPFTDNRAIARVDAVVGDWERLVIESEDALVTIGLIVRERYPTPPPVRPDEVVVRREDLRAYLVGTITVLPIEIYAANEPLIQRLMLAIGVEPALTAAQTEGD